MREGTVTPSVLRAHQSPASTSKGSIGRGPETENLRNDDSDVNKETIPVVSIFFVVILKVLQKLARCKIWKDRNWCIATIGTV
jgi:hypothetical protein